MTVPHDEKGNVVNNNRTCSPAALLLAVLLFPAGGAAIARAAEYEVPENRKASEILPPALQRGAHYRVREKVVCDGFTHHYTVESDYGVFEVSGDGALRKLIREIAALSALHEVKRSSAFGAALADSAKGPFRFGRNLIRDPVPTLQGVPKGIYSLFRSSVTAVTNKRDPHEDSRAAAILTMSGYKRVLAGSLGVDPYSANTVLQKDLNSVAWASALGGLGVTVATAPLAGPVIGTLKVTRLSSSLNDVLAQAPPTHLRRLNRDKLIAMGISEDLAKEFLDQPFISPRHETVITGCLAELKDARGRAAFLKLALQARDDEEATFYQHTAELLRAYHVTLSPIAEIVEVAGFPLATAKDKSALLPIPMDHGVWQPRARIVFEAAMAKHRESGSALKPRLWITGTLSVRARRELVRIGFEVHEKVYQRFELFDWTMAPDGGVPELKANALLRDSAKKGD